MSHVLASSIFWAAVAVCAIAQVAIVRSALGARASVAAPGTPAPRSGAAAELLWVLLPALMLAGALLLTWRALDARSTITGDAHPARDTQYAAAAHPVSPRYS